MKKSYTFTLCILLHSFILLPVSHSQNRNVGINYEIFIPFVKSQFVQTKYITTGWTNSIPPHEFKAFDCWTYQINLEVKLNGEDFVWKSPIEVILTLPDETKHSEIVNSNSSPLYPGKKYEYIFNLDTKRKGWVKIEMNSLSDWDNLNVPNVKFIGSSVFLD